MCAVMLSRQCKMKISNLEQLKQLLLMQLANKTRYPTSRLTWIVSSTCRNLYLVDSLLAPEEAFLQLLVVLLIGQSLLICLHSLFMLFHEELQVALDTAKCIVSLTWPHSCPVPV